MQACSLHDEGLFMESAIAHFGVDVGKPRSDAASISEKILLIDDIIVAKQEILRSGFEVDRH